MWQWARATQLRGGMGYRLVPGTNGTVLEIVAGSAGVRLSTYRFVEMAEDHIVCHTWDGTTEGGTDVFIAKPTKLRFSIETEELRDVTMTYTEYSTDNQTRLCTDEEGVEETQWITPPYEVGDVIYAIPCETLVTIEETETEPEIKVELLDVNIDARAWMAHDS